MNKQINNIYILIRDNKAIVCESNLKELFDQLPDDIKDVKAYLYYSRQMRETNYLNLPFNKAYFLQRVDYTHENPVKKKL